MLSIANLSKSCQVRRLTEANLPQMLALCQGNPLYYEHCPPAVTEDSLRQDMAALPPRKTLEDKYFLGFFQGEELVAILDLITAYPNPETAFFGFFMVKKERNGTGFGSQLVEELCRALKADFRHIRLGYVSSNPQSKHFWEKNGFIPTGVISKTEHYDIVVLEKTL